MGILDDAIREHLELKRKHGAAEEELQRQEEEALGPARREVSPSQTQDSNGSGEPVAAETGSAEADVSREDETAVDGGAVSADRMAAAPIVETPSDAPAEAPELHEPAFEAGEAEPAAREPEPAAREPEPAAREPESAAPKPESESEFAAPEPEFEQPEPVVEALEPEAEELSLPAGDTPPRGFEAFDDEEPIEDEGRPDAEEGDPLENTPDFLQETPEHDRLWFEQKPPRDFDFD